MADAIHRRNRLPMAEITTGAYDPEMSDGYQGGSTTGGRWGCGFALLIGSPVGMFLTLANTLGDCEPGIECHHFWAGAVLPTVAVAAAVGFGIRFAVNRSIKRQHERDR